MRSICSAARFESDASCYSSRPVARAILQQLRGWDKQIDRYLGEGADIEA